MTRLSVRLLSMLVSDAGARQRIPSPPRLFIAAILPVMRSRIYPGQDEDGVFVPECPALPGCISQGNTRTEATENIQEAVEGYLKRLAKHGEPVPPGILEKVIEAGVG